MKNLYLTIGVLVCISVLLLMQLEASTAHSIPFQPANQSWYEIGEYSPDGSIWYPYIELNKA